MGGVEVVDEGLGLERAPILLLELFLVEEVGGQEELGGVYSHRWEMLVSDPRRLLEPVSKTGGSIVHSLVIFSSYQTSVCSAVSREERIRKSSRGIRQVRKPLRCSHCSIADSHDGASSQRERRSAPLFNSPAR